MSKSFLRLIGLHIIKEHLHIEIAFACLKKIQKCAIYITSLQKLGVELKESLS